MDRRKRFSHIHLYKRCTVMDRRKRFSHIHLYNKVYCDGLIVMGGAL